MGGKHKTPSGRGVRWYAGRYSASRNLYVCGVCGAPLTPGETCRRCEKRTRRAKEGRK